MRALAFNHCIPSSILRICVICGFSSLVFPLLQIFVFLSEFSGLFGNLLHVHDNVAFIFK